ncbi:hypothetical protein Mgra_00005177 [Meloidogyne graminicola]|uniref:Uncharacterized protein n=1 Tax=Meloidogyne graminicola TaxID=189291 RepID=A0A8S9ZQ17_9BILA|nr:hypothetical protein Mgra_00005177 [Meloidogyne graminicola]
MREELEILRGENKLLRERNIKLTTQLSGAHRRIGQLEREKAQLKQQVEPETKKAKINYPTTPPRVVPDKEKIRFIKQQNSLRRIDEIYTCCENKCINSNFVLGSCVSNNGYVNISVDGKVKYFIDEDDGKNNWIQLYACAKFNKGSASTKNQSLFYFEVKIMKETDKICYAGIGLCETNANIFYVITQINGENLRNFLGRIMTFLAADLFIHYGTI